MKRVLRVKKMYVLVGDNGYDYSDHWREPYLVAEDAQTLESYWEHERQNDPEFSQAYSCSFNSDIQEIEMLVWEEVPDESVKAPVFELLSEGFNKS